MTDPSSTPNRPQLGEFPGAPDPENVSKFGVTFCSKAHECHSAGVLIKKSAKLGCPVRPGWGVRSTRSDTPSGHPNTPSRPGSGPGSGGSDPGLAGSDPGQTRVWRGQTPPDPGSGPGPDPGSGVRPPQTRVRTGSGPRVWGQTPSDPGPDRVRTQGLGVRPPQTRVRTGSGPARPGSGPGPDRVWKGVWGAKPGPKKFDLD